MNLPKSKPANHFKEERIFRAIQICLVEGIYPSAAAVSQRMGRNTRTLNGSECITRRMLFKRLGIKMKTNGNWAGDKIDYEHERWQMGY